MENNVNEGLGNIVDDSKKETVDVKTEETIGNLSQETVDKYKQDELPEKIQDEMLNAVETEKLITDKAAEIAENKAGALSDEEIQLLDNVEKKEVEIKHPEPNDANYQPSDEELLKGVSFKSYKSNKAVDAAVIAGFSIEEGEEYVVTVDPDHPDLLGGAIHVPAGYIAKHNLADGDYITKHKDGHYGYCPKKVFERDYDEVKAVSSDV